MIWDEHTIAELTRLWEVDGLAASEIGDRMGTTRSTVLGKVHRLGLAARKERSGKGTSHAWPEQYNRILREMREAGATLKEIGSALGVSRNTVTRRVATFGLQKPLHKHARVERPQRKPPAVIRSSSKTREPDVPDVGRVRFTDLTPFSCRWIPGNPDGVNTLYCGDAGAPGKSYCERHRALMYTPLPKPTGKPFSLPGRRAA